MADFCKFNMIPRQRQPPQHNLAKRLISGYNQAIEVAMFQLQYQISPALLNSIKQITLLVHDLNKRAWQRSCC